MSRSPAVILYDATGVELAVADGVAIPANTRALILAGKDATGNARFARVATDGTVRTDPTGTTTQPVSAASLPLPTGAAAEHITAASPHAVRLADGAAWYSGTNPLPVAVSGGSSAAEIHGLAFGASITSPAWPAIKPLSPYVVPAGKTLKIYGVGVKTAAATTYMALMKRRKLWGYSAVLLATPGAPTLAIRTYVGGGMTAGTYRYKIVACNNIGRTLPGTEASITLGPLTDTSCLVTWTAVTGALWYEVYRTVNGGATNTETFVGSSLTNSFLDLVADSEKSSDLPPAANDTQGSRVGDPFPSGQGGSFVMLDVVAAITAAVNLDIVYRNVHGRRCYMQVNTGTAVATQTPLLWLGLSNPTDDRRVPMMLGHEFLDAGINEILACQAAPATGQFNIYAFSCLQLANSKAANVWEFQEFAAPVTFVAGEELVIGTSANASVGTAARNDIFLAATLE